MENPLVSIIVITYNSSKYVLETLESAKAQTYQNIELIISDDGSQDETVNLCKNWLAENKERFVHSQIITVEQNTGIPANCNRGVKASKGEWIKLIAGDDILMHDGCQVFRDYLAVRPNVKIVQGLCTPFLTNTNQILQTIPPERNWYFFKNASAKQLRLILNNNFIIAPGIFIHSDIFKDINGFDEEFNNLEDYPFWLKVLNAGYTFNLLEKEIVYYRKHAESVSATVSSSGITPFETSFLRTYIKILKKYKNVNPFFISLSIFKYKYYLSLNNSGLQKNRFTDFINKVIYKLV